MVSFASTSGYVLKSRNPKTTQIQTTIENHCANQKKPLHNNVRSAIAVRLRCHQMLGQARHHARGGATNSKPATEQIQRTEPGRTRWRIVRDRGYAILQPSAHDRSLALGLAGNSNQTPVVRLDFVGTWGLLKLVLASTKRITKTADANAQMRETCVASSQTPRGS